MNEYRHCNKCGRGFYADVEWKRTCLDCWIKSKNSSNSQPAKKQNTKELEDNLIMAKKMIYLCHPDKHNNSIIAHEVFKFLIKERDELIKELKNH